VDEVAESVSALDLLVRRRADCVGRFGSEQREPGRLETELSSA
jgi:hypothetical protein